MEFMASISLQADYYWTDRSIIVGNYIIIVLLKAADALITLVILFPLENNLNLAGILK